MTTGGTVGGIAAGLAFGEEARRDIEQAVITAFQGESLPTAVEIAIMVAAALDQHIAVLVAEAERRGAQAERERIIKKIRQIQKAWKIHVPPERIDGMINAAESIYRACFEHDHVVLDSAS